METIIDKILPVITTISLNKKYKTVKGEDVRILVTDKAGFAPVVGLIKPPEREYFYTKRCKVCNGIFFKNKISKEMSDNLWDNPNIEFITSVSEVCAEIASVCELHAEEYYKSQA